jgi:hypothetical protein
MADKKQKPKPKKKRAEKYETKLAVAGTFAGLVKTAMHPKKPDK